MTDPVIIPTLAASPVSLYDEPTVYAAALSGASVASLYAAGQLGIDSDPQADLGLEELYGADQPHDTTTPPLLANGFTRVRWNATQQAYALDQYVAGLGYMEVGRVTVWGDDTSGPAAGIFQYSSVLATELVRWTPEHAVLQVVCGATVGGQVYRAEVYIRLGRGWLGPRFEVYPARRGSTVLGAHLRFSPFYTDAPFVGTVSSNYIAPSDDSVIAWAGQAVTAHATENWAVIGNQNRMVGIAHLRTGIKYRTYTDSVAYGAARGSVAIAADQATAAVAGYVTARYGFGAARAPLWEAEAYMAAAGTRTSVADAAAGGGTAINDTQTSYVAASMSLGPQQLARLPLGKYAVWARVRVTTSGDTGSVRADFSGSPTSIATTTSLTYVWLYLGETTHGLLSDAFGVGVYRSAGVGATGIRLDRVALVPTERRLAAAPVYDGGRDLGQEFLFESRAIPELVAR